MENEETEDYTTKDMCKDIVKETAKITVTSAIAGVAGVGILLTAGVAIDQVQKFRARRSAKKNQTEES